ncbi:hypothetical protein A0130_12020 [Leifsonia xyli]|nr:hypothetical protein A0130_12020 [Leifsonia xyli]
MAEEAEPEGRGRLVEASGEHEVGDRSVEEPGRVIVRDGERASPAGENRLKHVGRLDGGLIHPAVAQQHELDGSRRTVRHDDHEPFAVAVE